MPHSHPHSPRSVCRKQQRANTPRLSSLRSRGFTLVELMVVIGIIGLLTAISVPIVMQSLAKARNAAIKAEIDMLHMAMMNYKNEYGSFPPAFSSAGNPSVAAAHVRRLFPRCDNPNPLARDPANALVRWLRGYSTIPTDPLGSGRQKLFDFDSARITASDWYHPSQKLNSPYLYISSVEYSLEPYLSAAMSDFGAHYVPPNPLPNPLPSNMNDLMTSTGGGSAFFNPDTFQILCAGRDEEFGTDDDLSNFWPGTRREYLDSLRN